LEGTGLDYESLKGSDTLSVFIGKIDVEHFRSEAPNDCFEIYNGKDADVVVYYREYQEKFDRAIDSARIEQYSLIKTDLQGQIESIIGQLKSEKNS